MVPLPTLIFQGICTGNSYKTVDGKWHTDFQNATWASDFSKWNSKLDRLLLLSRKHIHAKNIEEQWRTMKNTLGGKRRQAISHSFTGNCKGKPHFIPFALSFCVCHEGMVRATDCGQRGWAPRSTKRFSLDGSRHKVRERDRQLPGPGESEPLRFRSFKTSSGQTVLWWTVVKYKCLL